MKKSLKRLRATIADNWQLGLVFTITMAAAVGILFYQLGSLLGGLSADEYSLQQQVATNAFNPESLLRNPLYLPYYLMLYLLQLGPFHGPTALRAVGALFGLVGAASFFIILRSWYTQRVALLGTVLFMTSGWFLFSTRTASPESSYLLLLPLIAGAVGLHAQPRSKLAFLSVFLLGPLLLYVPGVTWFLLPTMYIQRATILQSLRLIPTWLSIVSIITAVVMLIPLVAMVAWPAGMTALDNVLVLLGLPQSMPSLAAVLSNLSAIFGQVFFLNNNGPVSAVSKLPWLDITSSVLVLLGIIQFVRHYKLDRTKLLGIIGLLGIALLALGGPVSIVLLLPFVYLVATEGLRWLLELWLQVFPRNPFARGFAVIVVTILVLSIATYQVSRYFIAWSSVPETRALYNKVP